MTWCTVTFRSDVVMSIEGEKVLLTLPGRVSCRSTDHETINAIAAGSHTADELPVAALTALQVFLAAEVRLDGRRVVLLERTGETALLPEPHSLAPDAWLRLGRFSLLRRRDAHLVLESPLSKYRAVLLDPGLLTAFASPRPVSSADPRLWPLLGLLAGAGFLDTGVDGEFPDESAVLRQWDVHDLYFHSRSRRGRTDEPTGGWFPFLGEIEPLPAVKPVPDGPRVELHRPERLTDLPLQEAIEARCSIRSYGEEPITAAQLGEFLYRTARVRGTTGPGAGLPHEVTSRPYPCGGAEYDLELYLTVRRCAGVRPGSYHYDPAGHALTLINDCEEQQGALLRAASMAAGGQAVPDVLVTMTSRFQRLSWKYRGIAYSLTLKHVGVLTQNMYLVATAMGLAGCALGIGDADATAAAFGLDYLQESSVGEFVLGSAPLG